MGDGHAKSRITRATLSEEPPLGTNGLPQVIMIMMTMMIMTSACMKGRRTICVVGCLDTIAL